MPENTVRLRTSHPAPQLANGVKTLCVLGYRGHFATNCLQSIAAVVTNVQARLQLKVKEDTVIGSNKAKEKLTSR